MRKEKTHVKCHENKRKPQKNEGKIEVHPGHIHNHSTTPEIAELVVVSGQNLPAAPPFCGALKTLSFV